MSDDDLEKSFYNHGSSWDFRGQIDGAADDKGPIGHQSCLGVLLYTPLGN